MNIMSDLFTEMAEDIGFQLDQRLLSLSELKSGENPYENEETRLAYYIYTRSRAPLLAEIEALQRELQTIKVSQN